LATKKTKNNSASKPAKYEVVEGDTEFLVSRKLGVSVGGLRDANMRFKAPYLRVGRKINIPR